MQDHERPPPRSSGYLHRVHGGWGQWLGGRLENRILRFP